MASVLFSRVRLFDGDRFLPGLHDVAIRDGVVARGASGEENERIEGGVLFPGFVDAHVHLAFSSPAAVLAGGVTTVVDLGAPEVVRATREGPAVRASGPILTAPTGYPTRSWGAGGFGLEVSSAAEAARAVESLVASGAGIIKFAVEPSGGPLLDGDALTALTGAAHDRGLLVAAHALGAPSVATALDAGADILAHTPVEPLPASLVRACGSRGIVVVSTLRAFGAAPSARDNLRELSGAGCAIVYGTDLGNAGISPGLDIDELALVARVLGSDEAALASATSGAGAIARRGGRIEPGAPADLVWVRRYERLEDLAGEKAVYKDGARLISS